MDRRADSSRAQAVDKALAALADPTRRAVVEALSGTDRSAGDIARHVAMSPAALSRHLKLLRAAGVLQERISDDDARVRLYRLNTAALAPLAGWLEQIERMWSEQLSSFKSHAEAAYRRRTGP